MIVMKLFAEGFDVPRCHTQRRDVVILVRAGIARANRALQPPAFATRPHGQEWVFVARHRDNLAHRQRGWVPVFWIGKALQCDVIHLKAPVPLCPAMS